ncbi:MAG: DUF3500 domain-containing protein [Alphaproteobacteria bacterium]|nr:MAG: DUF3500 domain-containing protein [Alphaproteobacteria bacterium]
MTAGDPAAKTRVVVEVAAAFLKTLDPDQRSKVQLPFTLLKTASLASFPRTAPLGGPGGLGAPGRPGGSGGPLPGGPDAHQGGPSGDRPKGPGRGPGIGPMPGFVGERYGQAVWSNYPVSDVPRPGIQLGKLNAPQRAAALRLLQTLLSARGYQTVREIMGSDQALSEQGQRFASGEAVYTIAILGTPSATTPWMVEFGGHHLGLNVVIAGSHGVMTPTLEGAQPSIYTAGGKTVRVLAAENDKAFALLDALDPGQRRKAILNYEVGDLVLGPGHAGQAIVPEGLKASAMTPRQRALLLDLIGEWAGVIDGAYAKAPMDEIREGLDETWFAWSGATTHAAGRNGSAYYRIQGPKLVIEFSPQGVGGDPTMHVHTMYRDPTNDYGVAYTLK